MKTLLTYRTRFKKWLDSISNETATDALLTFLMALVVVTVGLALHSHYMKPHCLNETFVGRLMDGR